MYKLTDEDKENIEKLKEIKNKLNKVMNKTVDIICNSDIENVHCIYTHEEELDKPTVLTYSSDGIIYTYFDYLREKNKKTDEYDKKTMEEKINKYSKELIL